MSVPEVLLTYRIHPSSVTSTKQIEMRKRKHDLIGQYDFRPIFQGALKNWRIDIRALSKTSNSSQRKFLSCVDLIAVSKRVTHKKVFESLFQFAYVFVTLLDFGVAGAAIRYYFDGSKRRAMR